MLDNWSVLSLQSACEHESVIRYRMCQCVFHTLCVAFLSSHQNNSLVYRPFFLELNTCWNLRLDVAVYGGGRSQCRHCSLLFQPTLSCSCVLLGFLVCFCILSLFTHHVFSFLWTRTIEKLPTTLSCGFLWIWGFVEIDTMLLELSNMFQGEVVYYSEQVS